MGNGQSSASDGKDPIYRDSADAHADGPSGERANERVSSDNRREEQAQHPYRILKIAGPPV
jgi:hypothetical protein